MADDQTWRNCGHKNSTAESTLLILPNGIYYDFTDYCLAYNAVVLNWGNWLKLWKKFFPRKNVWWLFFLEHIPTRLVNKISGSWSALHGLLFTSCGHHTVLYVRTFPLTLKRRICWKKTDEKIKTGRSILTKIYANLVTIMFEEEKMRFRWRLTANKFWQQTTAQHFCMALNW